MYFSYFFILFCFIYEIGILCPSSYKYIFVLHQLFVKALMLLLCLATLHTKLNVDVVDEL